MDVNNTILFPNNVDPKNRTGQNVVPEGTSKPEATRASIQAPTDETRIPTTQELVQASKDAEQIANTGTVLDRGSFVNFVV